MGILISILAILLLFSDNDSTARKIKNITTNVNLKHPSIYVNVSAITILINEGYDEKFIVDNYPAISKIIKSYVTTHNDDIYKHRVNFLAKILKLRNSVRLAPEAIYAASVKKEKTINIFILSMLVVLPLISYFAITKVKKEKILEENKIEINHYGLSVEKAFEQAASDGDSAVTVAELSDNKGKVYLSPELNFKGNKFYISEIEGFESYALIDNTGICDYSYEYHELVDRVKKYKFGDGCYEGKYFFKVKPVYSEEDIKEMNEIELQEEVKRLRNEIEILKTNNR